MPPTTMRRKNLPAGEVLCTYCTARCCRYFALPYETPTTWKDFDNMRWFMLHGRVSIFVDNNTWYVAVHSDCQHLLADHRCGIYQDRPEICREYTTAQCEYDNDFLYDRLFETPEQIWEYAEAVLPPRKKKRSQKRALPTLPILNGV